MEPPQVLLVIVMITLAVSPCKCQNRWSDTWAGDGRDAYINARVINMRPSKTSPTSRTAITPEAAEATSTSQHTGVHRLYAPQNRRSYATVNADNIDLNNKNFGVQPRARSAQDIPRGGPNRSNGNPNMPALVMGGVADAQTYEGAVATAATDALGVNRGGRGTAISSDTLTSRQPTLRRPARGIITWGVTSQPVGSAALVGSTNGIVVLAQGDSAVAMAQTEQNSKDKKWVSGKLLPRH